MQAPITTEILKSRITPYLECSAFRKRLELVVEEVGKFQNDSIYFRMREALEENKFLNCSLKDALKELDALKRKNYQLKSQVELEKKIFQDHKIAELVKEHDMKHKMREAFSTPIQSNNTSYLML